MSTNQLEQNEVLVRKEDFENLDINPITTKEWIDYKVFILTITTNEHYYVLKEKPERMDMMVQFFQMLLNEQKNFISEFFTYFKNKDWTGAPEPKLLPIYMNDLLYLNMSWYPEVQTKNANQYLHVHVEISIAYKVIRGLSILLNYKYMQDLIVEIFGHTFKLDLRYGRDNALALKFYIEKTSRSGENKS